MPPRLLRPGTKRLLQRPAEPPRSNGPHLGHFERIAQTSADTNRQGRVDMRRRLPHKINYRPWVQAAALSINSRKGPFTPEPAAHHPLHGCLFGGEGPTFDWTASAVLSYPPM